MTENRSTNEKNVIKWNWTKYEANLIIIVGQINYMFHDDFTSSFLFFLLINDVKVDAERKFDGWNFRCEFKKKWWLIVLSASAWKKWDD